ncbi:hypothetical protein BH09PLA1_BH09PLA1_04440 [soil metagenome]
MWYFAYGHDMNWRSLAEWSDRYSLRPPLFRSQGQAAVLQHYRLAFPRFDEYWGGGVADIIDEPGKSVFGALIHISVPTFKLLERMHDRRVDGRGSEIGQSKLIDVAVSPYRGGERIAAVAMQGTGIERGTVPPTRQYVSRMVESALELDLSALWVMQLQSFVSWNESAIEEIASNLEPATRLLKQARREPVLVPALPLRSTSERVAI